MPTLDWIGKDKVINYHSEVSYRVWREYSDDEKGIIENIYSENMIIFGNNLKALKVLMPKYERTRYYSVIDIIRRR